MTNTKNCPACQAENPVDATVCTGCGTALVALLPSVTTVRVPDAPSAKTTYPKHIVELTHLYADALIFQVLGHDQPVLVKGGGKVLIGRYTPGETPPSIDLNPYNGAILGVSRLHAQIMRVDNAYTIEDLGSTNGTWLNEARLAPREPKPLNNGDLLRLGQLGAYVYFRSENVDQQTEETVLLKYDTEGTQAFDWTVRSWSQSLMPYLSTLTDLQAICDQLHSRQPSSVIIHTIMHDAELSLIKVIVSGASDALMQLKTAITYATNREPAAAQPSSNGSSAQAAESPVAPPSPDMLAAFANKLVADLSPALPEPDQKAIADRLQTVLRILVEHPLKIS